MTNAGGTGSWRFISTVLKLEKRDFVKSVATIFMITKATPIDRGLDLESIQLEYPHAVAASGALHLLGFFAGLKTQDRVNQKTFSRGLMVLLSMVGVILITRALSQALK